MQVHLHKLMCLFAGSVILLATSGATPRWGRPRASEHPYDSTDSLTSDNPIDRLVLAKLRDLKIEPAAVCSDAVFFRRAYLDVIGTLPTAQEARDFLADRDPNKRRILINRLLERDEFADYWAMKWCDLLRVKAEFPINLWPNAVQAYHRWIRASIRENKPFDRFARELLTSSGSNFRIGPVNFYRAMQSRDPQGIAQTVALTFMGCRAEAWPKDRLEGMAGFFSLISYKNTLEWKEEIVYFDQQKAYSSKLPRAVFPDGTMATLSPERDPREQFAEWLIDPKNPYFTRAITNRVWYWLMGRGIVHEPDDLRPDNPPKNPELLAYLEKELVAAKYDLKHLFRIILNSRTYQLSPVGRSNHPDAEAYFARYPIRRLEAEVLIDALCQITGTTEKYSSPIPEPFTYIPEENRSIALADGSISSSFLEMFGRPSRDSGLESERSNKPTANQRLHLLNSSHIQRKIENSRKLVNLMNAKAGTQANVTALYLTILNRYPTEQELKVAGGTSLSSSYKGREALVDLAWALINSSEFLYRH